MTHPSETLPPSEGRPEDHPPGEQGSGWVRLAALAGGVLLLGLLGGLPLLIVVVAILLMIFLHELGHYLTAKWAGMKVTEFFLFFGPRVWSFRRGETEYGVKAIPAGAYVRIVGMHNLEEVPPEDEARTYRQKPYWRRMSVAVAGSAMHFLIALVLLFVIYVGYGVADSGSLTVSQLAEPDAALDAVHPDAVDPSAEAVAQLESGTTPAQEAGLQEGDHLVSIGGERLDEPGELQDYVRAHPGDDVTVVLERDGDTVELPLSIASFDYGDDPQGWIGLGTEAGTESVGPLQAAGRSVETFGIYVWESTGALGGVFTPSSLADFGGQVSDPDQEDTRPSSPVPGASGVSENRLISIVGAVQIGSQATESGVELLLSFLVLINVFIGLFNLIPLLPFDGGHVAIATYEKIRELIRGGRERYYADVAKLMPLTYGVVAVLVTVGLLALYLDLANPITLPE